MVDDIQADAPPAFNVFSRLPLTFPAPPGHLKTVVGPCARLAGHSKTALSRAAAAVWLPPAKLRNAEQLEKMHTAGQQAAVERRLQVAPTLPEGFTMSKDGRSAFIYYKAGDRVLEVYVGMSGVPEYDMLVAPGELDRWVYPPIAPLTEAERVEVIRLFLSWLGEQGIKSDFRCP